MGVLFYRIESSSACTCSSRIVCYSAAVAPAVGCIDLANNGAPVAVGDVQESAEEPAGS